MFTSFVLNVVPLLGDTVARGLCSRPGGSMCCVLGQDTFSLSPPRSMSGYHLIVGEAGRNAGGDHLVMDSAAFYPGGVVILLFASCYMET